MKKLAFWGVVFTVFGTYATGVLTYAHAPPTVEAAYAKTIEKNDKKEKKHGVYIVAEVRQNPFVRILERLKLRAAHERELCEVSEEQLAELEASSTFDVVESDIGGKKVKVATPHQALFADDFRDRNIHCQKLAVWEKLILMFAAHVS